jgi:hypothetical protein
MIRIAEFVQYDLRRLSDVRMSDALAARRFARRHVTR